MLNEKLSLYLLFIVSLLLTGQLAAQLYTVNHRYKVSGRVLEKETKKTGYNSNKYAKAYYSLVLTLNERRLEPQTYNIDLDESNFNIDDQISVNDVVTVYSPTALYNILSLDCLNFGSRVSQVKKGGCILSSFRHR